MSKEHDCEQLTTSSLVTSHIFYFTGPVVQCGSKKVFAGLQ